MSRANADKAKKRDGVICYCGDIITNAEFVADIRENRNLGFDKICAIRGVGHQCTACLLDAEALYYEAMAGIDADADADAAPAKEFAVAAELLEQQQAPSLKRRIFDLADQILPNLAKLRREIAPIFVSESLTTTLSISNQFSEVVGSKNAPIRIGLVCFDEAGKRFHKQTHSLSPGERFDAPIGEWLARQREKNGLTQGGNELATGSCWIDIVADGEGYVGSIRPHFTLLTDTSACNLHTQEKNARDCYFGTYRCNPEERQFIAHINLSPSPTRIVVHGQMLDAPGTAVKFEKTIPGRGADIIEIPMFTGDDGPCAGSYGYTFESESIVRRHWLAADQGLERVSADHL